MPHATNARNENIPRAGSSEGRESGDARERPRTSSVSWRRTWGSRGSLGSHWECASVPAGSFRGCLPCIPPGVNSPCNVGRESRQRL